MKIITLISFASLAAALAVVGSGCRVTLFDELGNTPEESAERVLLRLETHDVNTGEVATARLTGTAGGYAVAWHASDGEFRVDGYRLKPGGGFLGSTVLVGEIPAASAGQERSFSYRAPDNAAVTKTVAGPSPLRLDWVLRNTSQTGHERFEVGYSPTNAANNRISAVAWQAHTIREPAHDWSRGPDDGRLEFDGLRRGSMDGGVVLEIARARHTSTAEWPPFEGIQHTAYSKSRLLIPDVETTALNDVRIRQPGEPGMADLRHATLPFVAGTRRLSGTLETDEYDGWLVIESSLSQLYVPGLVPLSWHPTKPVLLALEQVPMCDSSGHFVFVSFDHEVRDIVIGEPLTDTESSPALTLDEGDGDDALLLPESSDNAHQIMWGIACASGIAAPHVRDAGVSAAGFTGGPGGDDYEWSASAVSLVGGQIYLRFAEK